jgi:hypothetical protein
VDTVEGFGPCRAAGKKCMNKLLAEIGDYRDRFYKASFRPKTYWTNFGTGSFQKQKIYFALLIWAKTAKTDSFLE